MKVMNQDRIEKVRNQINKLKEHLDYLESGAPTMDYIRKKALIEALNRTGHNRTHAAAQLGISIQTIRNWINKYIPGEHA